MTNILRILSLEIIHVIFACMDFQQLKNLRLLSKEFYGLVSDFVRTQHEKKKKTTKYGDARDVGQLKTKSDLTHEFWGCLNRIFFSPQVPRQSLSFQDSDGLLGKYTAWSFGMVPALELYLNAPFIITVDTLLEWKHESEYCTKRFNTTSPTHPTLRFTYKVFFFGNKISTVSKPRGRCFADDPNSDCRCPLYAKINRSNNQVIFSCERHRKLRINKQFCR